MSVRDTVIIGGGGFGRETLQWITDVNAASPRYRVVGFLDATKHGSKIHDLPVLGDVEWLETHAEVAAVIAIGAPGPRAQIVARLDALGVELPVIVHPRALVGANVSLGAGTIVCPNTVITTDVEVRRAVILNLGVTLGHDVVIGDYSTLSPGVNVSGFVQIGDGCDIGTNASFVPGVALGGWSVVGAGAVVSANLPGNVVAVGVPARAIKTRAEGWHLGEH